MHVLKSGMKQLHFVTIGLGHGQYSYDRAKLRKILTKLQNLTWRDNLVFIYVCSIVCESENSTFQLFYRCTSSSTIGDNTEIYRLT